MKKDYNSPLMEVIELNTQQCILAGSPGEKVIKDGEHIGGGGAMSRVFDDDDWDI